MNYIEAINYIENTGKFGMNFGLQRIERLCELLGNPEKEIKFIHVGGTNGKGSTTTFISSILMHGGYKVGTYTSPYIERFTERIKINDTEISETDVGRLVTEIKPIIDRLMEEGFDHPTEFEIITACAFKYFRENDVDFVVLEVGLGGRFDATNVVDPLLSVITTISYDHMNILGDTLDKIAFEKAGIIKENRPVVIYPQEKEAMEVLMKAAEEKSAPVYQVKDMKYTIVLDNIDGIRFNAVGSEEYGTLKIRLLGEHQVMNALTALKAVEVIKDSGCSVSRKAIYDGFENAKWPGRFEVLRSNPYIVLDGGHNIQGISALVNAARKYFPNRKINIVCGMLRDKNYEEMMDKLCSIGRTFITVAPNSPRALEAEELRKVVLNMGRDAVTAESIKEAVNIGLESISHEDVLIFCGSLYMIGEARTILLNSK